MKVYRRWHSPTFPPFCHCHAAAPQRLADKEWVIYILCSALRRFHVLFTTECIGIWPKPVSHPEVWILWRCLKSWSQWKSGGFKGKTSTGKMGCHWKALVFELCSIRRSNFILCQSGAKTPSIPRTKKWSHGKSTKQSLEMPVPQDRDNIHMRIIWF